MGAQKYGYSSSLRYLLNVEQVFQKLKRRKHVGGRRTEQEEQQTLGFAETEVGDQLSTESTRAVCLPSTLSEGS